MRNVERQAKALKLAMDAATEIQANPNWDYAHLVASIQGAILDMDEAPSAGIQAPLLESKLRGPYGMKVNRSVEAEDTVSINAAPGNCLYRILGNTRVLETFKEALTSGTSLEGFEVFVAPEGICIRYKHQGHPFSATLPYVRDTPSEKIIIDFFTFIFKNTPTQAFPQ